jgi:hypothetical protein
MTLGILEGMALLGISEGIALPLGISEGMTRGTYEGTALTLGMSEGMTLGLPEGMALSLGISEGMTLAIAQGKVRDGRRPRHQPYSHTDRHWGSALQPPTRALCHVQIGPRVLLTAVINLLDDL